MPQPRSGVGMLPAGVWRSSALLRASPSDHLPASTSPVGASADDPLPVADAVLRLDALLLPLHSGAGAGVVPPGSPRPGSAASFPARPPPPLVTPPTHPSTRRHP